MFKCWERSPINHSVRGPDLVSCRHRAVSRRAIVSSFTQSKTRLVRWSLTSSDAHRPAENDYGTSENAEGSLPGSAEALPAWNSRRGSWKSERRLLRVSQFRGPWQSALVLVGCSRYVRCCLAHS